MNGAAYAPDRGFVNQGQPQGMPRQQRQRSLDDYYEQNIRANLPDYAQNAYATRPKMRRKLTRNYLAQGALPRATATLSSLRTMNPQYGQAGQANTQQYLSDMGVLASGRDPINMRREGVDYQQGGNAVIADLSKYARERLGTGLTPEEEAVFRGRGMESVEATAAGSRRQAANMASASGLDPRAQMGMFSRIERGRQQQRAEVERGITEQELKRKAEIEDLTAKAGALTEEERQFDVGTAEGARRFDVGADLQRRQQLAALGLGMGAQEEGRYQYDTDFIEGRRQARMNRELLRSLQRAAAPTGLETASSILGGIRGGLSPNG